VIRKQRLSCPAFRARRSPVVANADLTFEEFSKLLPFWPAMRAASNNDIVWKR
jgi:hypothetical protein